VERSSFLRICGNLLDLLVGRVRAEVIPAFVRYVASDSGVSRQGLRCTVLTEDSDMRRHSCFALLAVVFLIGIGARGAHGQVLAGSGPCPGLKTFTVTGATPNNRVGFIHAQNTGSWVIPGGLVCFGTTTGLAAPITFAGFVQTNGSGNATVTATIPPAFCNNRYLQVIDAATCNTSNVLLIN
jgi:hypothetical protein